MNGRNTGGNQLDSGRGSVLAPGVLLADLLLLFGGEVVLDVEGATDLLGSFALDHVGHRLAGDVEQSLDVEVVRGEDQLEQRALVDLQELHVPAGDVVGAFLAVVRVVGARRVVLVEGAPLQHLLHDRPRHVADRDRVVRLVVQTEVLEHGVDRGRQPDHVSRHVEVLAIVRHQLHNRRLLRVRRHCYRSEYEMLTIGRRCLREESERARDTDD